jgi:hypothetical protein
MEEAQTPEVVQTRAPLIKRPEMTSLKNIPRLLTFLCNLQQHQHRGQTKPKPFGRLTPNEPVELGT